jgi:hypothetical protein
MTECSDVRIKDRRHLGGLHYRTSGFGDGIGWDLTGNLSVLQTAIRAYIGQRVDRLTGS